MGFPLRFRLGQDSTSRSTKVQLPCRRYDVPVAITHVVDRDIDYQMSRTMTLPSMQGMIHARASRASTWGRISPSSTTSSSTSSRRAVSGMKHPMPLFLPALARSDGKRSSGSSRRLTFGQEDSVSPTTRLSREPSITSHHESLVVPSDTSYAKLPGSNDQCQAYTSTSCFDDNCAHEDPSLCCSSYTYKPKDFRSRESLCQSTDEQIESKHEQSPIAIPAVQSPERSRASDLSFKCKGLPDLCNFMELPNNPMYCSSAEWPSSSLRQRHAEQSSRSGRSGNRSRIDIESWVNDNTILSFYDSSDDESLVCSLPKHIGSH